VLDGDAVGSDADGLEFGRERAAVGDNLGSAGKRPAIEQIIEARDGAGPRVTVMKSDPSAAAKCARQPDNEVRFDGVRFDDVGLEGGHDLAEGGEGAGVVAESFAKQMAFDANLFAGSGEIVGGVGRAAMKDGNGNAGLEGRVRRGRGAASKFEDILSGAAGGPGGLHDHEDADGAAKRRGTGGGVIREGGGGDHRLIKMGRDGVGVKGTSGLVPHSGYESVPSFLPGAIFGFSLLK
jgi:hypothetical protein